MTPKNDAISTQESVKATNKKWREDAFQRREDVSSNL